MSGARSSYRLRSRHPWVALALASCAVATDHHPNARAVALDVGGKWCAHLASCHAVDFAAKFASVDACAAATAASVPGDRIDTCDETRIATCRAEIEAAPCASPSDERPPASCEGC